MEIAPKPLRLLVS